MTKPFSEAVSATAEAVGPELGGVRADLGVVSIVAILVLKGIGTVSNQAGQREW